MLTMCILHMFLRQAVAAEKNWNFPTSPEMQLSATDSYIKDQYYKPNFAVLQLL